jgi:hypothetical protein
VCHYLQVAVSLRTLAGCPRLERLTLIDCLCKEGLDPVLHLRCLVSLDLSSVLEVCGRGTRCNVCMEGV